MIKNYSSKYLPLTLDVSQFGYLLESDSKYKYLNDLKSQILLHNNLPIVLSDDKVLNKCNLDLK